MKLQSVQIRNLWTTFIDSISTGFTGFWRFCHRRS